MAKYEERASGSFDSEAENKKESSSEAFDSEAENREVYDL